MMREWLKLLARTAALGVALWLAVGAPSWGQGEHGGPQSESSQSEAGHGREKSGPGDGVALQRVLPTPIARSAVKAGSSPDEKTAKAAAEKAERDDKRSDADLVAQEVMATAAIWMAILTACQVIIGGIGLFALFRTLRLTRDSVSEAGKSAAASERAADAAIAAVTAAKDTAERQLRAYISCVRVRLDHIEPGVRPRAKMTFRNAGSTPADGITIASSLFLRKHPPKPGDAIIQALDWQTSINLGPDAEIDVTGGGLSEIEERIGPAITEAEILLMNAGKLAIYVHIDVSYIDIFGKRNFVEQRSCTVAIATIGTTRLPTFAHTGTVINTGWTQPPSRPLTH